MNIYMTIGFPGSGKSTWCSQFVKDNDNTIIINRDALRTMIKNEYAFDFKYEPFIKQSSNKMIIIALGYGFDIIIDETHIKSERRKEIINLIRNCESSFGKIKIIYVWFTECKNNIEFRMKENRGYAIEKWNSIIENMKDMFEEPIINEEDCDELIKINPLEGLK